MNLANVLLYFVLRPHENNSKIFFTPSEEKSMTQPKCHTHLGNIDLANNWNFSLIHENMKSYRKVLFTDFKMTQIHDTFSMALF